MDSTLSPLTLRSEVSLNRLLSPPIRAHMDLKPVPSTSNPPVKRAGDGASAPVDPPSSPFDFNIDQENLPPLPPSDPPQTPSRVPQARSSTRNFVIHEDYEDMICTPRQTPVRSALGIDNQNVLQPSERGTALPPPEKKSRLEEDQAYLDMTLDLGDITCTMPETKDKPESYDPDCDVRSTASDDTSFSAFSAIPNVDMTQFSKLGNRSPSKAHLSNRTPATAQRNRSNETGRITSPTPRQQHNTTRDGDTTNLLLDFTQQFENVPRALFRSPTRGQPSQRAFNETNLQSFMNGQRMPSPKRNVPSTPSRRDLLNLLDFDLPPQPTPRSVPSITIRELESLKSSYLSEISSLKASLSGREAEVESLKRAVGDAERRVGEALEQVREERNAREHAEKEKVEWEKKGKEVENVLMSVKEEFLNADREKEDLLRKLDESNRFKQEAEIRAAEAAIRASVSQPDPKESGNSTESLTSDVVDRLVAEQLDDKMENLARELHAVYKKKHESKVATLKKTYEVRSEKKCQELQRKAEDLVRQNEDLQAALNKMPLPGATAGDPTELRYLEKQRTEIQKQLAQIARLTEEIISMRETQELLIQDLEAERVEKGELVAAVDEMLTLQSEVGAPTAIEDFRKSIRRPLEMRAPVITESRIGRFGLPAPSRVPSGGKSRIMTNIERMGGGRAQD